VLAEPTRDGNWRSAGGEGGGGNVQSVPDAVLTLAHLLDAGLAIRAFRQANVMFGTPSEHAAGVVRDQLLEPFEGGRADPVVEPDLTRSVLGRVAEVVAEHQRPRPVLHHVELVHVDRAVVADVNFPVRVVAVVQHVSVVVVRVEQREHVAAIHLRHVEVEDVEPLEIRDAAPDEIAVAVVDVRPHPGRAVAFLVEILIGRQKPMAGSDRLFVVHRHSPPGGLDVRSLHGPVSNSHVRAPSAGRANRIPKRSARSPHGCAPRPADGEGGSGARARADAMAHMTPKAAEGREGTTEADELC